MDAFPFFHIAVEEDVSSYLDGLGVCEGHPAGVLRRWHGIIILLLFRVC
jgi:hypothetical protein